MSEVAFFGSYCPNCASRAIALPPLKCGFCGADMVKNCCDTCRMLEILLTKHGNLLITKDPEKGITIESDPNNLTVCGVGASIPEAVASTDLT